MKSKKIGIGVGKDFVLWHQDDSETLRWTTNLWIEDKNGNTHFVKVNDYLFNIDGLKELHALGKRDNF